VETGTLTKLDASVSGNELSMSPDGKWLVFDKGGEQYWEDKGVRIVFLPRGGVTARLVTKAQAIYSAAFSPDGKTLALGCGKDPCRTNAPWDPKTEVGISLWETATWRELRSWSCPEAGRAIRHLAWSPDGTLLASGETKGINLWDPGSGRLVKSLPSDSVDGVVFDPKGRRVLGGTAAAVLVWDLASGREPARLAGGGGEERNSWFAFTCYLAISPDGKRIAYGGRDGLFLRDLP
jgi:WD40 repeat protein